MTEIIHSFLDDAKNFRWEKVFETLSLHGPALLSMTPRNRWPVLHQAAYSGNVSVIKRLISLGADPYQINRDGDTAETVAQKRNNSEAAEACKSQPLHASVDLFCVAELENPKKIRVKVIGKGYAKQLRCQFPRKLRRAGLIFRVPVSDLRLRRCKDSYYYAYVGSKNIEPHSNLHVYADDQVDSVCAICMDAAPCAVLVPCGHAQFCASCASKLLSCPLCKGIIRFRSCIPQH